MPPKDYISTIASLQSWIKAETDNKHSMAVKYIEENVDLIDADLQKFIDDCPRSCQLEVYEMLLKAGIDMKDYVFKGSLKQQEKYLHDANQYYTINYKQELDDYIKKIIRLETDWRHDTTVLDAWRGVED